MITSAKVFTQSKLRVLDKNLIHERVSWRVNVFKPLFAADICRFCWRKHMKNAFISEKKET